MSRPAEGEGAVRHGGAQAAGEIEGASRRMRAVAQRAAAEAPSEL